jgi:RNA polymerase-binding transcription factor DksA
MNTKQYKEKLEKELSLIETELKSIGRKNPDNQNDWEAVEPENDGDTAEDGDVAENMERFEINRAELNQLEAQLNLVKGALEKIKNGTYGKCSVCEKEIEEDRLEANPSATTCKLHMNK